MHVVCGFESPIFILLKYGKFSAFEKIPIKRRLKCSESVNQTDRCLVSFL